MQLFPNLKLLNHAYGQFQKISRGHYSDIKRQTLFKAAVCVTSAFITLQLTACSGQTMRPKTDQPATTTEPIMPVSDRQEFIIFDSHKFTLAGMAVNNNSITNEYLLAGESFDDWQKLFTARIFKQATKLKEVLPVFVNKVRPYYVGDAKLIKPKNKPGIDDTIFEALLHSPDYRFFEYTLHRFVETTQGVVTYEYSEKFSVNDPDVVNKIEKSRKNRTEQLFMVRIPIFEN